MFIEWHLLGKGVIYVHVRDTDGLERWERVDTETSVRGRAGQ